MQALQFERYLDAVCSGILSDKARDRVRQEMLDHLTCRMEEREAQGMDETDAAEDALRCFGDETDVRTQITRAHKNDNVKTVVKWGFLFLLSVLISILLLGVQILFLEALELDRYFLQGGLVFLILSTFSYDAATNRRILLPLCLIPPALCQCYLIYVGAPSFLIAIPELFTRHLIDFLTDIVYHQIAPTTVSTVMMYIFILLFAVVNLMISISSFRLNTHRTTKTGMSRFAKKVMKGWTVAVLLSCALCLGFLLMIPRDFTRYDDVREYDLIPASSEAELQDILHFYAEAQADQQYPGDAPIVHVSYSHDLNSELYYAKVLFNGELWESDGLILNNGDCHRTEQRDLFYARERLAVEIAPPKTAAYYVAMPMNIDGGAAQPERARIIQLPLTEDVVLYGKMCNHVYEIDFKAAA